MKKILALLFALLMCLILVACDDNQKDDSNHSDASGEQHEHVFGEWAVATAATCTTDGTEERTCACGEKETKSIAATGHTFGEWAVATVATCTEDGTEERTCACGEKETKPIAATGHTFGEWALATAATCTADGTEERACACGEKETKPIAATGHTFGEWTVATAATCTEAGVEERACSCGEKETQAIQATGHSFDSWKYQNNQLESVCSCGELATKPISEASAVYSYLAGTEMRTVKRSYSSATPSCAYVYAFVNSNGHLCVLIELRYKIVSTYQCFVMYNMSTGARIINPDDYYQNQADRSSGANKVNYLNMQSDILLHDLRMLQAMQSVLSGGDNTYGGVFVSADGLGS